MKTISFACPKHKLMTMITAASLATGLVTGLLGQTAKAGAFPSSKCQSGYSQQGPRLCMTGYQTAASFQNAELYCQDKKGRLSDYNDWRYRYFRGDGELPQNGIWLGPRTADNKALYVNGQYSTPGNDFDGETDVVGPNSISRSYTCSHDDNR